MAKRKSTEQMIRDSNAVTAGEKQPIDTVSRKVVNVGGTLYVSVTDFAQRLHQINAGDDVEVHITHDSVIVEPETENNE